MFSPRLDRQIRYVGEAVQAQIEASKVAIIGGGNDWLLKDALMQHLLIGSRNLTIITDGKTEPNEHWFGMPLDPGYRAHSLAKIIKSHLEETIRITPIVGHCEDKESLNYLANAQVIFECTNDPYSKGVAFLGSRKLPVFSMSCSNLGAGYRFVNGSPPEEGYLAHFMGTEQSGTTSMVASGFAMQDYIQRLTEKKGFSGTFHYRFDPENPFLKPNGSTIPIEPQDLEDIIVLLIGNGAVGTAGNEMLARMGICKGYSWDPDRIEDVNRHAQAHYLFLADDIQRNTSNKALVCSQRINSSYRTGFIGEAKMFTTESEIPPDVGIVFSYVDRIYHRAVIDAVTQMYEVPHIYGATSTDSGSAAARIPRDMYGDGFPTMDSYFLLDSQVEDELRQERTIMDQNACGQQVFASLVPVNFIIGSLTAHLVPYIAKPEKYGHLFRQVRKYTALEENRCVISHFDGASDGIDFGRVTRLKEIYHRVMGDVP